MHTYTRTLGLGSARICLSKSHLHASMYIPHNYTYSAQVHTHLGIRISQYMLIKVPSARLHVHAIHNDTVLRLISRVFIHFIHEYVLEGNSVDGVLIFSREILQSACEERGREEETADPVGVGVPEFYPPAHIWSEYVCCMYVCRVSMYGNMYVCMRVCSFPYVGI